MVLRNICTLSGDGNGSNILGRADNLIIFDPIRGMLVFDDQVFPMPLEAKLLSKHETYALNVRLTAAGRVTICSDINADINVPGYDVCE